MKRNFLIIGLLFCFIVSACKKDNNDADIPILVPVTKLEKALNDYGLFNSKIKFINYKSGLDTNLIFFYGKMDKKLEIRGFDKRTKAKIFDWTDQTPIDDSIFTVDLGYGQSKTYFINISMEGIIKQDNDYVFIIKGACGPVICYSDLYQISNQSFQKKRSLVFPAPSKYFNSLTQWCNNTYLLSIDLTGEYLAECICYSMKGEELFKVDKEQFMWLNQSYYTPINLHECVSFKKYDVVYAKFIRSDISTGKTIWESEKPLADLPKSVRIDKVRFTPVENGYITYYFDYTLYSGEKGLRTIKVNIETGKFEKI